eukprot:COSAG02_NODE_22361_length_755_cov_0.907012_2_plen_77_part_01
MALIISETSCLTGITSCTFFNKLYLCICISVRYMYLYLHLILKTDLQYRTVRAYVAYGFRSGPRRKAAPAIWASLKS